MSKQLYLRLFHGCHNPDECLSDWGIDGPWIGPLASAQITYANTLKLVFVRPSDAVAFGLDPQRPWLHTNEFMLMHGGIYYGEWMLCFRPDDNAGVEPVSCGPWPAPFPSTQHEDDGLEQAYEDRSALPDTDVMGVWHG